MMDRKYLIWLDILGFDKLSEEIARKRGRTERRVREDLIKVIKESTRRKKRKNSSRNCNKLGA